MKPPLCVWHLSEHSLAILRPGAKLRARECRRKGSPDCFRPGNSADSCFLSAVLRPAPTLSLAALVSGGREGRRAEGGGGGEGRRALGCELGGGRGGESPSAGVGAGKPGANVDNRLEVSPGEPPFPPLQRPGGSGVGRHRPGLLLPRGPVRLLGTPALRERRAGDGPRVRRRSPQTPLLRRLPSTREGGRRGCRGAACLICPGWASGPEAGSPPWRGEEVWGVEESEGRLGRALWEPGGKRGRGNGEGGCVCGRMWSRETGRSVSGSGGEGVWGAKLGLGQGRSAKVTVDPGGKGSCGEEASGAEACGARAGGCGRRGCRGRGSVDRRVVGRHSWVDFVLVPWAENSSLCLHPGLPGPPVELKRRSRGVWLAEQSQLISLRGQSGPDRRVSCSFRTCTQ